jgi:hypothetical protein
VSKGGIKRKGSNRAKQKDLLRELAVLSVVFLLPAMTVWTLGVVLEWSPRPLKIETWLDWVVFIFFVGSIGYYSLVIDVLLKRMPFDRWMRHARVAVPMMAAALLLWTFYFSGAARKLTYLIYSNFDLDLKISSIASTVLGWMISGVIGNFAYDRLKKRLGRADAGGADTEKALERAE